MVIKPFTEYESTKSNSFPSANPLSNSRNNKNQKLDRTPHKRHPSAISRTRFRTHVDILNPPAEYTAASAKPTTVPLTKETNVATAPIANGIIRINQMGGRFLSHRDLAVLLRLRRRFQTARAEQASNVPPTRISVQ